MATQDRVRLQIPVSAELAGEIESLGNALRRSQRWMATELLNAVVEERQSLADYLAARVVVFVRDAVLVLAGRTTSTGGKQMHLDLSLPAATASFIETLANQLGHTPAKMASVMLQWGVQENDFAIRLVAQPLLAAHRGIMAIAETTNAQAIKEAA
jgi:hypothetical protein